MNEDNAYYVVITEWLYPTESGRDLCGDYDTYEQALNVSRQLVYDECKYNWSEATHTDPSIIEFNCNSNGYIIADKNGLEKWWFQAKIIKVNYGLHSSSQEMF